MPIDKANSGTLRRNLAKLYDTHPDWKGTLFVKGEPHWIAGWWKKDQDGVAYLSIGVKPRVDVEAEEEQQ